jgi:hypothetical protein
MPRLTALALLLLCAGCPDPSGKCKTTDDCVKGRTCCDGTCKDTENDRANCGGCGAVCETPNAITSCRVGRCQFQCSPGWGNCNDDRADGCELDLTSKPDNCARCGRVCESTNASSVCADGLCGLGPCRPGFGNCDSDSTNGCEIETASDDANCGACGNRCELAGASSRCEQSACVVTSCNAGFGDCDGVDSNGCEENLLTTAIHCGACNRVCGPGMRCGEGRCRADELIAFGGALGFTSSTVTNEVYRFDLIAKTFSQLTPPTPDGFVSPRRGHVAVWDEPRNRMITWGGVDGAGTPSPTDTWALDFTVVPPTWRKLATTGTPPSGRFHVAAALDARSSTWYLFGGTTELGAGLSELFTLDLATLRWTQVHGVNAPNAPANRINAMAAFDPVGRKFVLFGGTDHVTRADLRDTWAFDVATGTWGTPLTSGPAARGRGAFFDGSPAFLFSGIGSLSNPPAFVLTDLYSYAPWTQLGAAGPEPRFSSAHTTRDGRPLVFAGGTTGAGGQSALSDLWSFDPSTQQWTRLFDGATGVVPSGKISGSLVGR